MIAAAIVLVAAAAVWIGVWWATRRPPVSGDHVSQAWRDAYTRERHD